MYVIQLFFLRIFNILSVREYFLYTNVVLLPTPLAAGNCPYGSILPLSIYFDVSGSINLWKKLKACGGSNSSIPVPLDLDLLKRTLLSLRMFRWMIVTEEVASNSCHANVGNVL